MKRCKGKSHIFGIFNNLFLSLQFLQNNPLFTSQKPIAAPAAFFVVGWWFCFGVLVSMLRIVGWCIRCLSRCLCYRCSLGFDGVRWLLLSFRVRPWSVCWCCWLFFFLGVVVFLECLSSSFFVGFLPTFYLWVSG